MQPPFPAYEGDAPYFFVSYAHADAEAVFPEMTWLHEQALPLWYDDGIHVGSNWRRALAAALSDSAGMLFFCTVRSAASEHCLREINFALDHGKEILVVRLDDAPLPLELQLSLNDRQALVKSAFAEATFRSRLQAALRERLTQKPPAAETDREREADAEDSFWRFVMEPIEVRGGEALALLAEHIRNEIQVMLPSRYPAFVAAPRATGAAMEVLLQGSLRERGGDARLTLSFSREGRQFWTHSYAIDQDLSFDALSHLVGRICSNLQRPFLAENMRRAAGIPDDQLDFWAMVGRVMALAPDMVDFETRDRVFELVQQAMERYPDDPACLTLAAGMRLLALTSGLVEDRDRTAREALDLADRAVALGPSIVFALDTASQLHRQFGVESLALQLAERATAIHGIPFDSHYAALLQAGRLEEVLALESPTGVREGGIGSGEANLAAFYKAAAAAQLGELEQALAYARTVVTDVPQWPWGWTLLANLLMQLGQEEEARSAIEKVRRMRPGWTPARHELGTRSVWRNDEGIVDAMCAGLRLLDDAAN